MYRQIHSAKEANTIDPQFVGVSLSDNGKESMRAFLFRDKYQIGRFIAICPNALERGNGLCHFSDRDLHDFDEVFESFKQPDNIMKRTFKLFAFDSFIELMKWVDEKLPRR